MKQVGHRVRGIDWQARTSGRLAYVADIALKGVLHGAILRSPLSHARILSIDASGSRRMPGVRAVVTMSDLPAGKRYVHEGAGDRAPLADGVVRFVGEEVAAVAADTPQQAEAALRAIRVDYRPIAAPLTVDQALSPGATRLHERPTGETNLSHRTVRDWGDVAAGRRAASVSARGKFSFPRQAHACMETNGTLAHWDEAAQKLHLWTSTQAPYYIVLEVAQALGLENSQVVCHEVGVGGGFGSKSKICEHEVIAGALSRAARRPVRLLLSREEEFAATKSRHAFAMDLELHADRDGRLRAIDATLEADNGAYNHSGVSVMSASLKALGMLYRPDGLLATGRLVDTATLPGGQFRGYGSTQASFAFECLMDELAGSLGLDPFEIRLRNANRAGDTTLVGAKLGSARLVECLEAAREAIGWDRERANRRPGRGTGIASGVHVSGSHVSRGSNRSDAAIDVHEDGRVRVRFGGSDAGTGQRTILAQIAAEELGVPLEKVDVLTMESERTPFDMGAWSSRGTHYGGHAVRKAALAMAERLKALAAPRLGAGKLWLEDGMVCAETGCLPIGDAVRLSNDVKDGMLSIEASFVEENVVMADRATGRGNVSPSYNFACHAAVVNVDRRTGKITVLDYVAAHDIGLAINPTATEGQAIGGAVMGLGAALGEELILEQGRTVNPAYLHYALPRAADVPRIRPILIEGGDPRGVYGAKAIGECSINPPASAIANAVHDAVGIRIRDLPITPDKILTALAAREGRRRRHALWRRPSRWWIDLVRHAYAHGLLNVLHSRTRSFPASGPATPPKEVATPTSVSEILDRLDGHTALLGGGTDLQPMRRQGLNTTERLVWTGGVAELRSIETLANGTVHIGAAVTLAQLGEAFRGPLTIVADAVDTIAGTQIREMATVGGNLAQAKRCWFFRNGFGCYKRLGGLAPCYAIEGDHRFYHAVIDGHRCQATTPSDLATVFQALDAAVVLRSRHGERRVAMERFYIGPGETVLSSDEIIAAVELPASAAGRIGSFQKLRLWEGDFSVASVAMTAVANSDGRLEDARLVFGGLALTPWRARDCERRIAGRMVTVEDFRRLLDDELDSVAHPLRRNGWKLDAAAGLAEKAFEALQECGKS
jgi:CO/xanthine dehydrogenase Mo-binding subunit/CO/xanthine dehydrogenase FAD-binding subunit